MIEAIDHIVFTVKNVDATCEFYQRVRGVATTTFGAGL